MSSVQRAVLFLALILAALPFSSSAADSGSNAQHAKPDTVRLLHRIYHPARPSEPFTERGAVQLVRSGPASAITQARLLEPSNELETDIQLFQLTVQNVLDELRLQGRNDRAVQEEVLYQLALEHPGDTHVSQWHVSSVKACHIAQSTSETVILHVPSTPDAPPFALDYFVNPVPHDGACPRRRKPKKSDLPGSAGSGARESREEQAAKRDVPMPFANLARLNSTVSVRAPRVPPLPVLRTPPPLTAEGKPAQPAQEKTFLQKYWMYIALGMVALVLSPGPAEEEGQGQGQAQGGQRR